VHWYNFDHRHSGVSGVVEARHFGGERGFP
jgi:hypothetical protein